jgi:glycosyltransferase involved in cell wall biosynthesis
MHIALVADAYPPMKTSGAVQIRDLVAEFLSQGHRVTVLLPDASLGTSWSLQQDGSLEILRLRAMETKDVSYSRRALAEHLLSYFMFRNLCKSPLKDRRWDGIVWYSPSIFFGGLVAKLKQVSGCRSYLILRDIFPEWAVDMGLIGRGMIYRYFKGKEKFQYRQADVIGVQTPSNLAYFQTEHGDLPGRVEVLNNWLAPQAGDDCSIDIARTSLAGRRIFVYTGNIGIAQGMDILIRLAQSYKNDASVGFLFVGRGTAVARLRKDVADLKLDNVLFRDEIPPAEIAPLLHQCHVGLIALDPRHRNDNIPGKFLAYMQAGLPVLATINPGNDLEKMILAHKVGKVISDNSLDSLRHKADNLLTMSLPDAALSRRCQELAQDTFSPTAAVRQIADALHASS